MIDLYRRLLKGVKTINMANRLHVDLDNWMTPGQFQALRLELLDGQAASHLPDMHQENSLTWISHSAASFDKAGKAFAEPFRRQCLDPYMRLFSHPDSSAGKGNKTLIVAVSGASQRMMMQLAIFLQNLDASEVDVLFLKYPKKLGFSNGMPGLDADFKGMLERMGEFPFHQYRRVAAMGTSGGALPALLIALRHGFHAVMTVGMTGPDDPRWQSALEGGPVQFCRGLLERQPDHPSAYLVVGEHAKEDIDSAQSWSQIIPQSSVMTISSPILPVGHNALFPLIVAGKFRSVLEDTILTQ